MYPGQRRRVVDWGPSAAAPPRRRGWPPAQARRWQTAGMQQPAPMAEGEPPAWLPPTWVLLLFFVQFAIAGSVNLLLARRWIRRRREGIQPPAWKLWSVSYTTPHHPRDGYLVGFFFLGLAALVLVGLVARLLNVW